MEHQADMKLILYRLDSIDAGQKKQTEDTECVRADVQRLSVQVESRLTALETTGKASARLAGLVAGAVSAVVVALMLRALVP